MAPSRLAVRYRQKGDALRKRRQQYRRSKSKSKRQSKLWRQQHPSAVKKYHKQLKLHPNLHKLRRRASERTLATEVPFWDLSTGQEGQVETFLPDTEQVQTRVNGEPKLYDLFDFLDSTAIVTEEAENDLLTLLDEYYEAEEGPSPDVVVARYLVCLP